MPGCTAKATDVDHIVRIADGGDVLDLDNVRALCHEHHKQKHRGDAR